MADASLSSPPADVNRGGEVVGLLSFGFALATILVALRFYVRIQKHAHGWDDYMIYVAWLVAISGETMSVLEVKYGLGRHIVYITPTLTEFLKSVTVGELTNALGVGFVKLSVCFFVLRLIDRTHRRVTRTLYSVMLLNTAVTLVAVFCIAFQCRPFEKIWHRNIPGHCFSSQILTNITRTVGALGCLTDFICVLIPVLVLGNLQMDRRTKTAVIGVFLFGLFTAACSIGKAVTSEFVSNDFTWQNVDVTIWAGLEHMLGIAVACMPTLRPILTKVTESARSHWHYWTDRASSEKTGSSAMKYFGRQQEGGGFDDIESASGDRVPMKPIQVTHIVDVDSKPRNKSDEVFGIRM